MSFSHFTVCLYGIKSRRKQHADNLAEGEQAAWGMTMMPVVSPIAAPRKYLRSRPNIDLSPLCATRVLDRLRERLRLMH